MAELNPTPRSDEGRFALEAAIGAEQGASVWADEALVVPEEDIDLLIRACVAGRSFEAQREHEDEPFLLDEQAWREWQEGIVKRAQESATAKQEPSFITRAKELAVGVPVCTGLWLGANALKAVEGALRMSSSNSEDEA